MLSRLMPNIYACWIWPRIETSLHPEPASIYFNLIFFLVPSRNSLAMLNKRIRSSRSSFRSFQVEWVSTFFSGSFFFFTFSSLLLWDLKLKFVIEVFFALGRVLLSLPEKLWLTRVLVNIAEMNIFALTRFKLQHIQLIKLVASFLSFAFVEHSLAIFKWNCKFVIDLRCQSFLSRIKHLSHPFDWKISRHLKLAHRCSQRRNTLPCSLDWNVIFQFPENDKNKKATQRMS